MSRVIVTKELAKEGLSVMRGRDWQYSNQDVSAGNKGKIIRIGRQGDSNYPEGWVKVKWEGGGEYGYRVGNGGCYDLYIYVPSATAAAIPAPYAFKQGDRVRLRNDHPYSVLSCAKVYTVQYAGETLMNLQDEFGAYEMTYFEKVKDEVKKSYSSFNIRDRVFVKNINGSYVRACGLVEDVEYEIMDTHPTAAAVKVMGHDGWWLMDVCFMTREEWLRVPKKPKETSTRIDKVRYGMQQLESKQNFKPNTNTDHERHTTRSADYFGSTLYLPSKNLTLKRGERPEGHRLQG